MKLKDLLHRIPIVSATADMDMDITGVSYDSRTTAEGDIFVAISGEAVDGHKFVPMGAEKGAVCAVVERPVEGIPCVVVENSRQALALMGGNWFDHPACEMTMIGVTAPAVRPPPPTSSRAFSSRRLAQRWVLWAPFRT